MEQQNEVELNYNSCVICQNNNYYVRLKLVPCKNEDCKQFGEKRNDICNQCIRNIQRTVILCPFCNKAQLQVNSFGQYRNPFIKKFTVGLFSTKYLATKATKLDGEQPVSIGSFNILPVIAFNLINLSEHSKDKSVVGKGKILLSHDKNVQAVEVMTENPQGNTNLSQEDKNELEITKYCLDALYQTCRANLVRCGTNQIFVSGGYVKDIDFLYGLKNANGKFVAFQDRIQDIWRNYQDGLFEQDQLIQGVQQLLSEYKQIQCSNQKMQQENEIPFYYPYLNSNYLINFSQKENSNYVIVPQPYLTQNRAYHQTVITNDKIYVFGGLCNGFVLDSIECATIKRDFSSNIVEVSEFVQIGSMTRPRANFSAVYKPAVSCTDKNCVSYKNKKENSSSCTNNNCANHEYIYLSGGQSSYGKASEILTVERYNFSTESCQELNLNFQQQTQVINQFNGMTLGVWKNDLFIFGGVPKNQDTNNKYPNSFFVLLKPGNIVGFETYLSVEQISNQINHCCNPEFTVSIPFQSQSEEEKEISEHYRSFIVYYKKSDNYCFDNYRIARNEKQEIKISKCQQTESKQFQYVDKQWIEQGFFEEQSYCLLNSYVDY